MKKTVVFFMIALLLLVLLSGCGAEYSTENTVPDFESTDVSISESADVSTVPDDEPSDTDSTLFSSNVITKAEFDIDGDGESEECILTFGPTSGLFTVVFTASQNGVLKYINTFNLPYHSNLHFEENEGEIKLVGTFHNIYQDEDAEEETVHDREEETVYYSVSVEENRIVLSKDGETAEYWGGMDWNLYGMPN